VGWGAKDIVEADVLSKAVEAGRNPPGAVAVVDVKHVLELRQLAVADGLDSTFGMAIRETDLKETEVPAGSVGTWLTGVKKAWMASPRDDIAHAALPI
jgi:hypothetical protein